jgi:hypothetical protein
MTVANSFDPGELPTVGHDHPKEPEISRVLVEIQYDPGDVYDGGSVARTVGADFAMAAAAVGIMLPMLMFMMFMQRHMVRGLAFGAVA